MKRKRKVSYPPARTATGRAPRDGAGNYTSPTVVAIQRDAQVGRKDIAAGAGVTILGSGLYAGETAVVERLIIGGIPAAVVRTESGATRRVRTIDLEPLRRPARMAGDGGSAGDREAEAGA